MKIAVYILLLLPLCAGGCSRSTTEPLYREVSFTMSRCFHAPIKVGVVSRSDEPTAHIKAEIYSGEGGYAWGQVERVIEKDIDKRAFLDLYRRAMDLNLQKILVMDALIGLDGSSWTLQIRKPGCAISVTLWTPTYDTKKRKLVNFVAVCDSTLRLAGIEIPKDEYY